MFSMNQPERHWGCRINDQVTYFGCRALILQNELLNIIILLDKGAEIISFQHKPTDTDFIWRAPNSLRSFDHFFPTGGSGSSDFFDRWSGGWFEVLPNGGPSCSYKGAELGNFAETINIPWEYRILEDTSDQITVQLWVRTYRTPFILQKTLVIKTGIPALFIRERVMNEGFEPMDLMWGHHPVVGPPFLDETCRIYAPPCQVEIFDAEDGPDHRMGLFQTGDWPIIKDRTGAPMDLSRMPPLSARTMDNCYLKGFHEGWIAVWNPNRKVGFGLAWDPKVFQYMWFWQALGGGIGYPWYGRTYNMGLEPWSGYPCVGLKEVIERGTHLSLAPGESIESWVTAVAFTAPETVSLINQDGRISR